jgi:hypothetical protein
VGRPHPVGSRAGRGCDGQESTRQAREEDPVPHGYVVTTSAVPIFAGANSRCFRHFAVGARWGQQPDRRPDSQAGGRRTEGGGQLAKRTKMRDTIGSSLGASMAQSPVNPITLRGSAIGQFEFSLENTNAFFVKSIEGGFAKANMIDMNVGSYQYAMKHLSTMEIDPIGVEVGMQDGLPLVDWIKSSWKNNFTRKNGHVKMGDFNMKDVFQIDFSNALITETTFPGLDAAGKEPAILKVKMQPESVEFKEGTKNPLVAQAVSYPKQKLWSVSSFALELGRYDTSRVAKIDSFTVKQGVKSYYTGRDRFPHWETTKLTFPEISVHMTYEYAKSMMKWYQNTVMSGGQDPMLEVDGCITYLAPSKDVSKEVFEIKLYGVGMKGMSIEKSERQDNPRRVKFDLYVTYMDINRTGLAY